MSLWFLIYKLNLENTYCSVSNQVGDNDKYQNISIILFCKLSSGQLIYTPIIPIY